MALSEFLTSNSSRDCILCATCLTACLALLPNANGELNPQSISLLQKAESAKELEPGRLQSAWHDLHSAELDDLPGLLIAMDDATPVGANWLSAAVDLALENAARKGLAPSTDKLTEFLLDSKHGPVGRETALDLLTNLDEAAATETTNKLLNDPVARMRRPAVAALLKSAENLEDDERVTAFQNAFTAALDEDQVVACAVALRRAGKPVDHIRKFGFIMHWQILGPFDYEDGKGFSTVYPPESLNEKNYSNDEGIYSDAKFDGKDGPLEWKEYVNTARNGVVDLNKAIDELRDSVAYGATVFASETDQDVQLRLRQQNSAKIWLNGDLVFSQPIGHTGNFFDQYTVPVRLKKGPNLILVKSCQWSGPVYHPFVGAWQFGVRVTDSTGNAIFAENRPPTPELDLLPNQEPKATPEDAEEDSSDESSKD